MVNIEWTDEAVNWVEDIYDYIASDNKKMASKIVKEIYNKVQILATFPQIGYIYPNHNDLEIRILLYGHYRIAYLVETKSTLFILGVFHGALDIKRYLK